jgi:hypothetical protein
MLQGNYKEINLDNIEPIYIEDVPFKRIERFKKLIIKVGFLDLPMTVQKDPKEDKYWLVAGYPEYMAYKETQTKVVYCLVESIQKIQIEDLYCYIECLITKELHG